MAGTPTIQTTALVHEAYLRLIDVAHVDWQHRAHFFAVSAQIMRHILVDAARKRGTGKRGGKFVHMNLDEVSAVSPDKGSEVIALDEALTRLAEIDARKARVVELRFFGGLSVEETAKVLQRLPGHGYARLEGWLGRWLLLELGDSK